MKDRFLIAIGILGLCAVLLGLGLFWIQVFGLVLELVLDHPWWTVAIVVALVLAFRLHDSAIARHYVRFALVRLAMLPVATFVLAPSFWVSYHVHTTFLSEDDAFVATFFSPITTIIIVIQVLLMWLIVQAYKNPHEARKRLITVANRLWC